MNPMNSNTIPSNRKPEPPFCSFCGKGTNQVKKMIQGPDAFICSDCIKEYRQKLIGETTNKD
ncbi:MAG: hypothetical protein FHK82_02335 [Sedimenticola thiotaurini]|uniref:ClpX-type ZB domain-containing protein n=1 Tax=Sedimenticola thiotaurini TaxID=1543721 RepID=A0A558DFN7_9GAMM|nr:MAG: hypothetical protein FHK82_02335 [Sedimenticola thiotaurini]